MHCLTSQGHKFNLQIINNKVSSKNKHVIGEYWKITYQLVPPDMHCRNATERAI